MYSDMVLAQKEIALLSYFDNYYSELYIKILNTST